MEDPGTLLAFLAAVLGPPASPTFGKLSCKLLPFPTLVVCALSYSTPAIILAAQIPHHNSSPILHILAVVSNCEFLDERENVEIVWKQVFFFFGVARRGNRRG